MKANNNKDASIIIKAISNFLNGYVQTFLTQSECTLESYASTLSKYLKFLENQGITQFTIDRTSFEKSQIEKWVSYMLTEEKLKPETCNVRLGGLRTFIKYLSSVSIEYKYLYLEACQIPILKTAKNKVSGISKKGIKVIMSLPDQKNRTGIRDLTFMVLAYSTGARMSELLDIKIKNIHLDGNKSYINVIGKETKIRTLYLLPKAVSHLKNYIEIFHGDNPKQEDYLFYSRNGGMKGKLCSRAIEKRLSEYGKQGHEICPDVPKDLHAHLFRHARATHWLDEGLNIFTIKELLGHEQIETTMKYLDITIEEEARALSSLDKNKDIKTPKKWKNKDGSLSSILKKYI